jgi:hypothetical protein
MHRCSPSKLAAILRQLRALLGEIRFQAFLLSRCLARGSAKHRFLLAGYLLAQFRILFLPTMARG